MPRLKKARTAPAAEVETGATAKPRRTRRPAKPAAAEAAPAPAKRTRKTNGSEVGASAGDEWKTVAFEDGALITVGEKPPRGENQKALVEYLKSRGRKNTTMTDAYNYLVDQQECNSVTADYTIRNSVFRGVINEA